MRNARRMMTLMVFVAALSIGAVILTTRAADQVPRPLAGTTPAATVGHRASLAPSNAVTQAPANTPVNTRTNTGAPAGATPPKAVAPGAPQVPEESATIRDDPTIAPDPKQSADNSVSFPNDI